MTEAEVSTNIGRIDAVVKTGDAIYIFEFKLRDSAEAALAQIKDKGYADRYRTDGRLITLIGVAFDQDKRNLGSFLTERLA